MIGVSRHEWIIIVTRRRVGIIHTLYRNIAGMSSCVISTTIGINHMMTRDINGMSH